MELQNSVDLYFGLATARFTQIRKEIEMSAIMYDLRWYQISPLCYVSVLCMGWADKVAGQGQAESVQGDIRSLKISNTQVCPTGTFELGGCLTSFIWYQCIPWWSSLELLILENDGVKSVKRADGVA